VWFNRKRVLDRHSTSHAGIGSSLVADLEADDGHEARMISRRVTGIAHRTQFARAGAIIMGPGSIG
jgi:hypothetical protein